MSWPAHAAPQLSAALDAYIETYYLAEGKLADFDHELDQALARGQSQFLAHSQNYRSLTALRILLEQQAHEITQKIQGLGDPEHGGKSFFAKLEALSPVDRFALHGLIREARTKRADLPVFFSSLDQELTARRAARHLIAKRISEARKNSALIERARKIADTLDFSFDKNSAHKVEPGAGASGNISGGTFPENTWALTFDDGPHSIYTPKIFELLQSFKRKASFMWLVECLEKAPGLPAKAKALGFSTNVHSWTHANLDKATPEVRQKEVVAATEKETEIYGEKPLFFRLPYGAGLSNRPLRQLIADQGLIHVFWNVDSLDWQDKEPASILARVKKLMELEKRGIILMHDIHPQTVEALKLLLQYASSGNAPQRRWVTLPAIVEELNNAN